MTNLDDLKNVPSTLSRVGEVTKAAAEAIEQLQGVVSALEVQVQAETTERDRLRAELARLQGGKPVDPAPLTGKFITRVTIKSTPPHGIVAFGHAFPAGMVRGLAAAKGDGTPVPIEVNPLRKHPDGSLRHVMVTAEVGAGYQGPLVLSRGSKATPEPWEALATLPNTEVKVTLGGTPHLFRLDNSSPVEAWISNSLLTVRRWEIWLPQPSLTLVIDAVFTLEGLAWVAVALENCKAAPTATLHSYSVEIRCEGKTWTSPAEIRHRPFSRWRKTFNFGGLGEVALDMQLMVASGALLSYDFDRFKAEESALAGLARASEAAQTADFMGSGVLFRDMQSGGMNRMEIGPLPGWDALAVLSQDGRALAFSRSAAEWSGRFPVHIRDSQDGFPYQVGKHPTASLHPNNQGSAPADQLPKVPVDYAANPDSAHAPSLGYLPYLLQPWDQWMLEEVHFWTSYHLLARPFGKAYRNGAEGLLTTGELRAWAWPLRTLALAAWITPDGHPLLPELERLTANNVRASASIDDPSGARLGWWGNGRKSGPGSEWMADDVVGVTVPWQMDFALVVWDWLVQLGHPDAAKFRDFLVRGLRGRFLEQPIVFDGTAQHLAASNAAGPYKSWPEIYQKTFAKRPTKPTDFWKPGSPFEYGAIARAAMFRAVAAGEKNLEPVLRQLDASCERFAANHNADPRWRIV